ncbi:calcium/sodium antiporter [Altererythrobacter lauratis]|uniref:Calcium/sodium antiporter n=1 Tax=Alteraurantiacibacter lauratis TaxID=2054627 RepID=A0ABV7EK38_9SPHN
MVVTSLLLVAGLVLLVLGGEFLVRGAVRIAAHVGISPMLVGLTVVGMGTSAPELAASVQASFAGSPGIALGNIAGSNIANLLLILGSSALIAPMLVPRSALWRDGGVGVAATLALIVCGHTLGLSRVAGLALLACLVGYIVFAYRQERLGRDHSAAYDRATAMVEADPALTPRQADGETLWKPIALVLFGLVLIVSGGNLLVTSAIAIAAELGVSDEVIGLTVVAIGTSLPELATSVIAALKKEGEIALGNVLGSNIFNVLFIGGVTGTIAPTVVPPSILAVDLWVVLGASLAVMLFALTGGRLNRLEGAALVALYGTYTMFTVGAF